MSRFKILKYNIFLFSFLFFLVLPFLAKAAVLGEEKKFFIEPSYDLNQRSLTQAVLAQITDKAYFYVDKNWWSANNSADMQKALDDLAREFSLKIYPALTSNFGSEWNPGIDKDSRIYVLLHPMIKEAGGYFSKKDEYSLFYNSSSNEKELIYLNTEYLNTAFAKVFLAHDFVHLITFNQKEIKRGIEEDVWLNEARAEYAPTLLGYDDNFDESNIQKRMRNFIESPSDSLTDWQGTKYDYAVSNVFMQYLVDFYGKKILIDSLQLDKKGIESLDSAFFNNGFREKTSDIFLKWAIAVYINNCSVDTTYCYISQNLKELYVVPQTNFLPLAGESSLSFADNLLNWSANWYKIIGGKDDLKIRFEGSSKAFSKIPYILKYRNGKYKVGFLTLNSQNFAEIIIKNFNTEATSFVIIPVLYNNNLLDGSYYSFFWSASVIKSESSNNTEDQETINKLLSQIEYLKEQISKLQNQGNSALCNSLQSNLAFNQSGEQVKCLQEFLKSQGVYPEGLVTGYFGQLTKQAIVRFQEKYATEILFPLGLSRGTGFVGNSTRAKINSLLINRP